MDNISATIPTDYIKGFRPQFFVDGNELRIKRQCKPKGLHKLWTKGFDLNIIANARLLNENYKMGFCQDTWDQFIDVLDKNCGLVLHPNFLKETQLRLAHVKDDIDIEPMRLLDELMLIGHWSKYQRVRRNNSITYENTNKTFDQSTTIYGKYAQMVKFKEDYNGLNIGINTFRGISRIETKLNNSKTIRNYFKTRNLEYILNQKSINGIIMKNILKGQPNNINRTDLSQFKSLNDEKDYFYIKGLCDRFNGDIQAIKAHIRAKTKNPKHQYKKIDKYLPMVKAPQGFRLSAIQEMRQQLLN